LAVPHAATSAVALGTTVTIAAAVARAAASVRSLGFFERGIVAYLDRSRDCRDGSESNI
jgi:hypothetical protein